MGLKSIKYVLQKIRNNKFLFPSVLFIVITGLLFVHFLRDKAYIEVELKTDTNGTFQVFWASKDQAYSENKSISIRIYNNKNKYECYFTNLKSVRRIRIDPTKIPSKVIIKSILIKQMGYEAIRFETIDDFRSLTPVHDIKEINIQPNGLEIVTSGIDPQLEVHLNPRFSYVNYGREIIKLPVTYSMKIKKRCDLLGLEFIPFVFLLLDFLLMLSICATLLKRIGYEFKGAAEAFLAAGIAFLSYVVLTTTILGVLCLLSWQNLLIFHLVLWGLIHFFVANKDVRKAFFLAVDNPRRLIRVVLNPIVLLAQKDNWKTQRIFETVLVVPIFIILLFYFIPAVFTLPLNYDSNTYRLSRIAYWLQEMNIYHFPTNDERQTYMAINCDLVMLWIMSFFNRGYPLVHLVQFIGGVLSCAAIFSFTKAFGFSRFWALGAVLFFLGIPNAACQLFTSQTDLFTTGCLVAGMFFLYQAFTTKRLIYFSLFGAGLGLALGAKGTVFIWGPGLFFWFLCQFVISRPRWKTALKGIMVAAGFTVLIGGFNYAQNLIGFGNPLAPAETLHTDVFNKEPSLSKTDSCFLRGSALFWQVFEPSSNLTLFHPLTNALLKSMENKIIKNIEGWKAPFVNRFKKATKWVRVAKFSEDYMSFGFLPFFLTVVGGLTGVLVAIRSKDMIAVQVTFMFISILLYMLFFPYVRAWSVHQYRYAILLTPFMSLISIFGFYYVFQHFNFFGIRFAVILVFILVLSLQVYMSFLISLKSLNHGWKSVYKIRSVPNYYYYWRDTNTFVERFNDRSYKIGLLVSKGPWSALFFRRQPRHKITYLSDNLPKYIDKNYFAENDIEVMISQNLSGIKLSGQFNLYQFNSSVLVAIVPQSVNPDLQPWVSKKDRWRDLWTKPKGSFQIGNWDKQFIKLLLSNPVPFERKIILSTSKEKQEFTLPPNQKTDRVVRLQVNPNDEISWKISPIYKPWKYSDTTDSRKLGIKLKVSRSD